MKVHTIDLIDGDRLEEDVFNHYGLHVLSKGTVLNSREISKLLQHQIEYVDIEQRKHVMLESRTLESTATPKWLPSVKPIYDQTISTIENCFIQAAKDGTVDDEVVTAAIEPLFEHLQLERDVVSMLLLLNNADNYTYQHSVHVGMLTYYLANWLGYSQDEANTIGKAGFLHDIGKAKVDNDILNSPNKLTNDEFEEIKQHTIHGYQIIKKSLDDATLALGALQHHERVNGSGYPYGLTGEHIHPIAKIISVADIYSAMISTRVYQKERDLLFVLRELYRLSFDELDPTTTHTFIKHMIPNFIGKQVKLNNDELGIIIMTHPNEFFRPLVQVDNQFIDLTTEREYEIVHVYL
ncbi:HD-GYP domain-containing protein [Paenibacillus yanchengensis]|uniref:HD-GYP domain-containing protein n=1 Tax=Paenibacillus yanchengensis TaxID=2035833 RepID=A0ABW4YNQ9_9BACL